MFSVRKKKKTSSVFLRKLHTTTFDSIAKYMISPSMGWKPIKSCTKLIRCTYCVSQEDFSETNWLIDTLCSKHHLPPPSLSWSLSSHMPTWDCTKIWHILRHPWHTSSPRLSVNTIGSHKGFSITKERRHMLLYGSNARRLPLVLHQKSNPL